MPDDQQKKIFSENLIRLLKEHNKTQKQVAKDLNINPQTLNSWYRGVALPRMGNIQKLADYFHVKKTDLIDPHKDSVKWKDNVRPIHISGDFIEIPVLGAVPAGVPVEAIENIIDSIKVSTDFINPDAEHFALRVKGDSMYPKYLEGDTIIVEVRHDCESGQDAIVYVNGYDATLKTVIKNDDGTITLKPRNPEWPSKTYGPDDEPLSILGPVVQQIRTP